MITISRDIIRPTGLDALQVGRTRDTVIQREKGAFVHPELTDLHNEFLRIVSTMAPPRYLSGTTFMRVLPAAPTTANETHRDKDNNALNFVCFVADGLSVQHEFFADGDFYEEYPRITPNGKVIMFTKDLHRRPTRPAGTGPKVFLTASLFQSSFVEAPTEPEPYVCHGGVLGQS